jgi:hypothetical protein
MICDFGFEVYDLWGRVLLLHVCTVQLWVMSASCCVGKGPFVNVYFGEGVCNAFEILVAIDAFQAQNRRSSVWVRSGIIVEHIKSIS